MYIHTPTYRHIDVQTRICYTLLHKYTHRHTQRTAKSTHQTPHIHIHTPVTAYHTQTQQQHTTRKGQKDPPYERLEIR